MVIENAKAYRLCMSANLSLMIVTLDILLQVNLFIHFVGVHEIWDFFFILLVSYVIYRKVFLDLKTKHMILKYLVFLIPIKFGELIVIDTNNSTDIYLLNV